jgi:hypothetical protein
VFPQASASALWSINHNFGYNPSVTVSDSGGSVVIANIAYVDLNNLTVTFVTPSSGTAYLV